jgi:hypothetical protein
VEEAVELPGVVQGFVDHELKPARLVLALAGSSQHMMQGLTLSPDAPLYGRATELFKLRPLPPGCIVDVLGAGDAVEAVRAYAVWGGIPSYWELAAGFDDLRRAVDALVLDPMGPLHEEACSCSARRSGQRRPPRPATSSAPLRAWSPKAGRRSPDVKMPRRATPPSCRAARKEG